MQISVTGKQIKVGDALQEYVNEQLEEHVSKYFENAVSADVVVSKRRHVFRVDIMVNEGTDHNIVIKSSAEASDIYASFDQACEKIEKQLRRYKRKIRNHRKQRVEKQVGAEFPATKYVLSGEEEKSEEDTAEVPLIIAEKSTKVEELTVSEAVMLMDLAELPALMFINRKSGSMGVVYRRDDGNISWVDAGSAQAAKKK